MLHIHLYPLLKQCHKGATRCTFQAFGLSKVSKIIIESTLEKGEKKKFKFPISLDRFIYF